MISTPTHLKEEGLDQDVFVSRNRFHKRWAQLFLTSYWFNHGSFHTQCCWTLQSTIKLFLNTKVFYISDIRHNLSDKIMTFFTHHQFQHFLLDNSWNYVHIDFSPVWRDWYLVWRDQGCSCMLRITRYGSLWALPRGFGVTRNQTHLLFLRYRTNQNDTLPGEPPSATRIQNSLPTIAPNSVTCSQHHHL